MNNFFHYDFLILFVIILTGIVQSVFGTGLLLFGTPILLLLGYEFFQVLSILLPCSIFINLFQLLNNKNNIDFSFFRSMLIFTVPFIILFLYFNKLGLFNINLLVGIFLFFLAFKDSFVKFIPKINYAKGETLYLVIMGIVHGISNLGGAILTSIIFSKGLSKEKSRATIAICYLAFALFQLLTMFLSGNTDLIFMNISFVYWILVLSTFYFTNKFVFLDLSESNYKSFFRFFLSLMSISLIIFSL